MCIATYKVCDHTPDCKQGEDEGELCMRDRCYALNCSHVCNNSTKTCECPGGYQLDANQVRDALPLPLLTLPCR